MNWISFRLRQFLPQQPALRGLMCVFACVDAWILVGGTVEAITAGNHTWAYLRPLIDLTAMVPVLLITSLTLRSIEHRLTIPWAVGIVIVGWLLTSILIGGIIVFAANRLEDQLLGEPPYQYASFTRLLLMALTVVLLFVAPGLYVRSFTRREFELDSERLQIRLDKELVEKEAKERIFHFLHNTVQSQMLLASKRILDLSQDPQAQNIREDLLRLAEDMYTAYSASMKPLLAESNPAEATKSLESVISQVRDFALTNKLIWIPDPHVGLSGMEVKLSEQSAAAITRSLQEAFINVVKHSADRQVIVGVAVSQMAFRTAEIVISVSNTRREDDRALFPSGEGLRFISALLSRIGASVDTRIDQAFFRLRIVLSVYQAPDIERDSLTHVGSRSSLMDQDVGR